MHRRVIKEVHVESRIIRAIIERDKGVMVDRPGFEDVAHLWNCDGRALLILVVLLIVVWSFRHLDPHIGKRNTDKYCY